MKYNELKQRVLDILCLDTEEANRLNYIDKIPRTLNGALFRVAHSIGINVREYVLKLTIDKFPVKVIMPKDFISFAIDQHTYLNGYDFVLTNFIGPNGIILYGTEIPELVDPENIDPEYVYEYRIFYNALFPRLSQEGKTYTYYSLLDNPEVNADSCNTEVLDISNFEISDNISEALPHYIVADLLSLDDKVRSTTEMNEFETLLATITVDRQERQRDYHSSKGWY